MTAPRILEVAFFQTVTLPSGSSPGQVAPLSVVRAVEGYTLTLEEIGAVAVGIRVTKEYTVGDGKKQIKTRSHRVVPFANVKSYASLEAVDPKQQADAETAWRNQFRAQ